MSRIVDDKTLSPCSYQLLLALTMNGQRVASLAQQTGYNAGHASVEAKMLVNFGLAVRNSQGYRLTQRGQRVQAQQRGEVVPTVMFPPEFESPARSIVLIEVRGGWEGQLWIDGRLHPLPRTEAVTRAAAALCTEVKL